MESTDAGYGWAADDPRWTDAVAGGRGRLEPSPPPRFGATDPQTPAPSGEQRTDHEPDGGLTAPPAEATPGVAAARPVELPPWPPAPPGPVRPPESPSTEDEQPPPSRSPFSPPLAIAAVPSPPTPLLPSAEPFGPPPTPTAFPPAPGPAPTSVPLRLHANLGEPAGTPAEPRQALPGRLPAQVGVELGTGYGLSTAATPAPSGATTASGTGLARRELRMTRLDRRVQLRSRRRADDEFRRAGRAELFSDDARYPVLLALTAGWYGPVALIYLAWMLLASGGTSGLLWLAAAATLSLAVAGLLRWASVGWRAITLSLAAALIGGGVTTIANALTG